MQTNQWKGSSLIDYDLIKFDLQQSKKSAVQHWEQQNGILASIPNFVCRKCKLRRQKFEKYLKILLYYCILIEILDKSFDLIGWEAVRKEPFHSVKFHCILFYLCRYTIKLLLTKISVYMGNICSDIQGAWTLLQCLVHTPLMSEEIFPCMDLELS